MISARVRQKEQFKLLRSPVYNYDFNRETGFFARWGFTKEHDPQFSPFGPEIADVEISTGDCSSGCSWCYKGNTAKPGKHMSLYRFEVIISSMRPILTQVALGITDLDANPDLIRIMERCRRWGIVPNLTMTGLGASEERIKAVASLAGAVAVSVYPHTLKTAYETIRVLKVLGLKQVNIHLLYHAGNMDFVKKVLDDSGFLQPNAVVLLGLKPKGRGSNMIPLSYEGFCEMVDYAVKIQAPLGFDSCSACKFGKWLEASDVEPKTKELMRMMIEPCESSLFSIYVDVEGKAWPCSFAEGIEGIESVDVLETWDFRDVWYSQPFNEFRTRLLANGRQCPLYAID